MISLRNLTFSYENHSVFTCPEMEFVTGQVHGIIGLNGAGKTTFFNLLTAFLKPDSGQILLNENLIQRMDVAFLEAENYFYPLLTGEEYLAIFPATNPDFSLEKLNQLLQIPLRQGIETYSTGMRKKLALLAILKQDKPIYILDEPFNGLDLETGKVLELMLERLKNKGKTIFISSHILSPLLTTCHQIHLMVQGSFSRSFKPSDFVEIEKELYGQLNRQTALLLESSL